MSTSTGITGTMARTFSLTCAALRTEIPTTTTATQEIRIRTRARSLQATLTPTSSITTQHLSVTQRATALVRSPRRRTLGLVYTHLRDDVGGKVFGLEQEPK